MVSVDLSARDGDGRGVVVLCGELDVPDAAGVAAALAVVAREPLCRGDMILAGSCA